MSNAFEAGDTQAKSDFPTAGDNFRTVGPWRILDGSGWHNWQLAALSAEIAVSRCHGDEISAARQIAALGVKKAREISAPNGAIHDRMPAAPFAGWPEATQPVAATLQDRTGS